jgi:hypothetical protein
MHFFIHNHPNTSDTLQNMICCFNSLKYHCRQRAPDENLLSSSGTSQLGMFDLQATTKSKYYDHIVLLYLDYFCLFLPICFCG